MLAQLSARRIEILLGLVMIALAYVAVTDFLAAQTARTLYEDALSEQRDLEAEAAQYNLDGMEAELARLLSGNGESAVPTRPEMELKISEIARLINEAPVNLGPIVQSEVRKTVSNSDIGLSADSPAPRPYQGIELSLILDGEVDSLLGLSERILANVPEATYADVVLSQSTVGTDASMSLRVLLYHQPL